MKHDEGQIYQIELKLIYVDRLFNSRGVFNPETCRSLADDIILHGLLQPVILRERSESELIFKPDKPFALIAGFRRFEAFGLLDRAVIPAIFRDVDEKQAFAINVAENLERLDISLENEVNLVLSMIDRGFTKSEISKSLNKSKAWVSGRLSLSQLPKTVKELVFNGTITIALALDISQEKNKNLQSLTFDRLMELEQGRLQKIKQKLLKGTKKEPRVELKQLLRAKDLFKIENYLATKLGFNNAFSDLLRLMRRDLSYAEFFDSLKKRHPGINWNDYKEVFRTELKK